MEDLVSMRIEAARSITVVNIDRGEVRGCLVFRAPIFTYGGQARDVIPRVLSNMGINFVVACEFERDFEEKLRAEGIEMFTIGEEATVREAVEALLSRLH